MHPPRILIPGGYGVFGRLLARELLATRPVSLVIAGRDRRRAAALCRELQSLGQAEPLRLDLREPGALARAASSCFAVVCAAGPFDGFPRTLPAAAVAAGAHWLDLNYDRDWVLPILAAETLHTAASAAGLVVTPGLSTTPALSGGLVRWCRGWLPDGERARVTLLIGNRNAKGAGAIASAIRTGLADPVSVTLPNGRHQAYRFASPDTDLLRAELSIEAEFRVAFELDLANRLMAAAGPLAARLGPAGRARLGRLLALAGRPAGWFGSPWSCLQVELWNARGWQVRAALISRGQRLAVLPAALAVDALLGNGAARRGIVSPASWFRAEEWVEQMQRRGILVRGDLPPNPLPKGKAGPMEPASR